MRSEPTDGAVSRAHFIARERAQAHPGSPFYVYAQAEMTRIEATLSAQPRPDRAFYESLTHGLGLMCAKELETSDPVFCDAVYNMMESIRTKVG